MAWLNGWSYRKTVSITGETGAGTDYQVNLSIGDGSGGDFNLESHCTSFPNDIQVTDNDQTTPLDYWIEDLTVDPISMWVEVADDLGSNVDICIYYGKSGESSASDGDATFDAFDDFEDGTIDKWAGNTGDFEASTDFAYKGSYSLKKTGASGQANAYLYIPTATGDVEVSARVRTPTTGLRALGPTLCVQTGDVDHYYNFYGEGPAGGQVSLYEWDNGASTTRDTSSYTRPLSTEWMQMVIRKTGNDMTGDIYYEDGTHNAAVSYSNTLLSNGYTGIHIYAQTSYLDEFYVRKYVSPEPAFLSAGAEESPPGLGRLVYGGLVNAGLVGGRLTG